MKRCKQSQRRTLRYGAEAIAGANKTRARFIARLFKRINALSDQEAPIFVVGDFNEPSYLDWTEAAAKAGRHPMKVEFPTSLTMAKAGFTDAYRTVHPDEMAKPGFTWTTLKQWMLSWLWLQGSRSVHR